MYAAAPVLAEAKDINIALLHLHILESFLLTFQGTTAAQKCNVASNVVYAVCVCLCMRRALELRFNGNGNGTLV